MIKQALTIAAVALAGILAAPNAEAGHSERNVHTYRSGQASCGCPIYTQRHFRGYNNCRRPIYRYNRMPVSHRSSCRHHASYRGSRSLNRGRSHGPSISIHGRNFSIGLGSGRRGASRGYSRGYSRGSSCR